jgi:exosortase C (VPDSG-CTERM-specific)
MLLPSKTSSSTLTNRHLVYAGTVLAGIMVFYAPVWQLAELSRKSELYSHFLLIPVVSLFFLFIERRRLFKQVQWKLSNGVPIMALGIAGYILAIQIQGIISRNDYLSLCLLGLVTWLHGGFILTYGSSAYRQALFPMGFLLFCVPIPSFILDPVIRFLQVWSAHAVELAFNVIGIPYFRESMTFQLPGLAIEVAKECSGIRSSLALFITSIMAGYMFLQSTWRKAVLVSTIIPITILKNAVRITTLSLLAVHIDKSWLTDSWLHKGGGIVFFVLALLFLAPVLWLLIRSERKGPIYSGLISRIRSRNMSK